MMLLLLGLRLRLRLRVDRGQKFWIQRMTGRCSLLIVRGRIGFPNREVWRIKF